MDKTALVETDISIGRRVTEALDAANIPVPASLWFYSTEAAEWRLIIATPLFDSTGPKQTYLTIQRVLKHHVPIVDLPLRRISVVSSNDPLIKLLRRAVRTGPGISGIRFTHNTINNVFIEDAYIYRLK